MWVLFTKGLAVFYIVATIGFAVVVLVMLFNDLFKGRFP